MVFALEVRRGRMVLLRMWMGIWGAEGGRGGRVVVEAVPWTGVRVCRSQKWSFGRYIFRGAVGEVSCVMGLRRREGPTRNWWERARAVGAVG